MSGIGAGGASSRIVRVRTPPHSAPSMLNFVTQCISATTVLYGSAVNSSCDQQCFAPSAVAPKARNSQRSARNFGTGP